MVFDVILERFCEGTPFPVMLRASLERLFSAERLDELFEREAVDQYTRKLTFSAVTDLLCEVVLRVRPSLRKAYQAADGLPATLRAVYDKLAHVETATAEALVRQVARDAAAVIGHLGGAALRPDPVCGLRLVTADGNYLAGTEHRLLELRGDPAAALPGMSVVLRDDRTGLLTEVVLREDAYTNERALSEQILAWLKKDDLLLGDRNYCTLELIRGASRQGFFLIRHNKSLHLKELSKRKRVGKAETGVVYQCRVRLGEGPDAPECRCIIVELFEPTRDGDTQLVLLTNVPAKRARATALAELYRRRWRLETSFLELTVLLRCEVETLAYPKAALFSFALALAAYNVYALLSAAVAAEHGREKAEDLSLHAVVEEVSSTKRGMEVALPDEVWERFALMSASEFACWLRQAAGRMDWRRYQKCKRAPKKPVKLRTQYGAHRSTARLLAERKNQ